MSMCAYLTLELPLAGDGSSTSVVVNVVPFITQLGYVGAVPKQLVAIIGAPGTFTTAALDGSLLTINFSSAPASGVFATVGAQIGV